MVFLFILFLMLLTQEGCGSLAFPTELYLEHGNHFCLREIFVSISLWTFLPCDSLGPMSFIEEKSDGVCIGVLIHH